MKEVKAIVLRAAGINCDLETEFALTLAGARAQRLHINAIINKPGVLQDCQILVFPGGFSYGDDVAAGKILANQVIHHLADVVKKFIDDGKLVLGICNGFQVLVKMGILPSPAPTLTFRSAKKQTFMSSKNLHLYKTAEQQSRCGIKSGYRQDFFLGTENTESTEKKYYKGRVLTALGLFLCGN